MVSARSVWAIYNSARAMGLEIGAIDRFFPGIDPDDKDGMLPLKHQIDMVRHILDNPNETTGLKLGINLPFDGLGLWGFLLRSSQTFGDMLIRAERYIRIVNKFPEFLLETRGDRVAQICTHPALSPFGPREQVVQTFLAHWLAWGRQLCEQDISPLQATFTWPGPADSLPFRKFYNCPVSFNAAEDALLFDKDTLNAQLIDATPQLSGEFEKYAVAFIERMTSVDDLLARVRAAIEEGLVNGQGREADVSARLAMTARTLHRKLKQQRTSFREVRDEVLKHRAQDLLGRSDMPIAEVSFLLGYSETSNFYRAFKRWTGTAPNCWREQNQYS